MKRGPVWPAVRARFMEGALRPIRFCPPCFIRLKARFRIIIDPSDPTNLYTITINPQFVRWAYQPDNQALSWNWFTTGDLYRVDGWQTQRIDQSSDQCIAWQKIRLQWFGDFPWENTVERTDHAFGNWSQFGLFGSLFEFDRLVDIRWIECWVQEFRGATYQQLEGAGIDSHDTSPASWFAAQVGP